jgi:hypothetical protein
MSGPEYGPDDEIRARAGEVMGPKGQARVREFATSLIEELTEFARSSGIADLERRCNQELQRRQQPPPPLPVDCRNCSQEIRKVARAEDVAELGELGTWFHVMTRSRVCDNTTYAEPPVDGPTVR